MAARRPSAASSSPSHRWSSRQPEPRMPATGGRPMDARKLVIVAAAALAGCANLGAGSAARGEVLFASAETIRIRWDNNLTSEQAVRSTARAYCSGRDVDEVD